MRDYCQHGEPMDEHCPQCNTKAAANDSATAPVPAGGTPEGLAREKVEMTDSEVKPSSPTTEAGRELLRSMMNRYPEGTVGRLVAEEWHRVILAIEQQARDEGRREAVREIEDVRAAARTEASYDAPRRPEYAEGYRQAAYTIAGWLDRVAGLEGEGRSPIGSNASEPPPTSTRDPIHAWHEDNDERPDASESDLIEAERNSPDRQAVFDAMAAAEAASESPPFWHERSFAELHDAGAPIVRSPLVDFAQSLGVTESAILRAMAAHNIDLVWPGDASESRPTLGMTHEDVRGCPILHGGTVCTCGLGRLAVDHLRDASESGQRED